MILLLDIDGTLADFTHRAKVAGMEPDRANQTAYQQYLDQLQPKTEMLEDRAIPGMLWMARALEFSCIIVYLTGRSENYREVTTTWLRKNGFPAGTIYMRSNNDWRQAAEYKRSQVLKIQQSLGMDIISIDDDFSNDCSAMYRSMGILHLKAMGDSL